MDKELDQRVSVLLFEPSLDANIFGAVAIIDYESGGEKIQCRMAEREKQVRAERRRDA
jgi:hypothetical protein